MEHNYCVYKHTCPNGKVYIGITSTSLEKRWQSGKGYKTQVFYRAIQKYGWDNILHEVLFDSLTKKEAEDKEIELIAYYKSNQKEHGYNINNGGSAVGVHSEETKRKISEKKIGNVVNRGRIHTEESKRHMSEAHIGIKLSEEAKLKLSKFNTDKKYTDEVIANMKVAARKSKSFPVYCIELNMKFDSIPEATEYVNSIGGSVIRQGIQKVVKGELKVSGKLADGTKLHWERIYDKFYTEVA
jgi:group I intron endonuclease